MIRHGELLSTVEAPDIDDTTSFWRWDFAWEVLPEMLRSFFQVTLLVTVVGTLIAAVLGLIIAILIRVLPKPLSWLVTWIANFIRMTPIVVQLLVVFYGFVWMEPMTIALVVYGVHYSTYMSEVYRAGIDSVPTGQWEATTALSLPVGRTWRRVIIPQALRSTVPSLGNYAISMFKDTPFLIAISVMEMVTTALEIGGFTYRYIETITIAGVIFLVASYGTAVLVNRLEKRLAYAH
ncbi:MAG TPA: ectoine/hydroxyectoine ABC transporter permease subunit EhuD [Enteractinococcus helveticum]|uniref:Ectoine/hydroxyectoine ABC transporter permease subunit EhuD n=1 Tax=Enteractinococcus helveticum TaxID=1837282 RepID=A0A921FN38_9MICC|nr:ectoine/hydroxyectoine ABC transporter permease subunit EhuD [Enteractinococcus helveticum]HJF14729.1 ectoine/hydroxyectoine ABC transporter permease subunit EhuD [Enteractinococcus helveticum]